MRPESETLELKRSTSELKEAVVSVAAILNKHGRGELVFGVRNDGAILGQSVTDQTLRDVSRALSERIEPRVFPAVERVRLSGKDCVRVRFSGADAPYLAFGRAYIRVGDEDRQLSARELERMFLSRHSGGARWEAEPSERRLSEADEPALRRLVKKANVAGRIDFEFGSVRGTLDKLGLAAGGRLLKAGEVLFCGRNTLEVQAASFAGTDKTTFLDLKQFQGTLFDVLEAAATYVKEHIDWRVRFGALERQEIPEIPVDALREALLNSLCHRDYRNPKGNEVAIFKDRVEIYNPGDFPEGYEPRDFITGEERSILRNPRIASVLFKSKDIEKWGSGLRRIAEECAREGVKVEFKVLKSGFLVVFHRQPASPGSRKGTREKTRVKTRVKIIALIRADPKVTVAELAERSGLSVKGVEWNVARLKKQGILMRVGSGKGGRWQIARDTAEFGEKFGARLGERLGEKLGETGAAILGLVQRDGRVTIGALSRMLQISTTAVEKALADLKRRGLLRRVGPDKGGHWELRPPPAS